MLVNVGVADVGEGNRDFRDGGLSHSFMQGKGRVHARLTSVESEYLA